MKTRVLCSLVQLQAQCHDGPVVFFWPHVDDISKASTSRLPRLWTHTVYPGIRESPVKLGQGSELIIALDQ
jgi:hypothetical protein